MASVGNPIVKYGEACTTGIPICLSKDGAVVQNPTISDGDFFLYCDNTSMGNLDATPTVNPAAGYQVVITLSEAECTCSKGLVIWHDPDGTWDDSWLHYFPGNQRIDDIPTSGSIADAVWDEALSGHVTGGTSGSALGAMNSKLPAQYVMGSSVQTSKDDEIDAIKAKTDNLPTDPADESLVEAAISSAVSPLAIEANVEGHVTTALGSYDPPTRTEATADKDEIVAAIPSSGSIADAVWDEVLSSGTHDILFSAGQRLRHLVLRSGTAVGGDTNYITFPGPWSSTDGIYEENIVSIVDGTGAGQTRLIVDYIGDDRRAYVDRPWDITPDTDSVIELLPFVGILLSDHGVATAGAADSITLAATASATNNIYVGSVVYISTGTGAGQIRLVTAYNGTSKVATVSDNWTTTPDNTSVYKILPVGRVIVDSLKSDSISASALAADAVAEIAGGVLDEALSGHTSAGTSGSVLGAISGKLPTEYIMGSSVQTSKDDEIDAIKASTDNLPSDPADESLLEAAISTAETNIIAAIPTATTIVDALLDEVCDSTHHFTSNTVGEFVTIVRGIAQQNWVIDTTVYDANAFMTSARIRIFATEAAATAATDGGSGEGEIASFTVTGTAESSPTTGVKIGKVVRTS